jgi:hypothetical protein
MLWLGGGERDLTGWPSGTRSRRGGWQQELDETFSGRLGRRRWGQGTRGRHRPSSSSGLEVVTVEEEDGEDLWEEDDEGGECAAGPSLQPIGVESGRRLRGEEGRRRAPS